jgi:hypothetical protein
VSTVLPSTSAPLLSSRLPLLLWLPSKLSRVPALGPMLFCSSCLVFILLAPALSERAELLIGPHDRLFSHDEAMVCFPRPSWLHLCTDAQASSCYSKPTEYDSNKRDCSYSLL